MGPYLVVGLVGGFLSGLFGIGGGLIIVPLLMWLAKVDQRKASATSLIAIIPAAITGSIGYALGGRIDILVAVILGAGAMIGAPAGTWLLRTLSLQWLRWLLVAMVIVAAILTLTVVPSRDSVETLNSGQYIVLAGIGLIMGVASGLFGIGGGIIVIPLLVVFFGVSDLTAKGTSLLGMIPGAIVGTVTNLRSGLVRLNEGLTVGLAAVVSSYLGVSLSFLLPAQVASIVFGLFLIYVAIQLARTHLTRRSAK